MRTELIDREIAEINTRFFQLMQRIDERDIHEASVRLNAAVSVLRTVRDLSHEEFLAVCLCNRCLVQPAVDDRSIRQAAKMGCGTTRSLFLASSQVPAHAAH